MVIGRVLGQHGNKLEGVGMNVYRVLVVLFFTFASQMSCATIVCPPMPAAVTDINHDVKSDISASVGVLGRVKAGEVAVDTEIVANNLFSKYPNVDKLFALQTMAATYCAMLQSSALPDSDKLSRWEQFQEKVLNLQASNGTTPRDNTQRRAPAASANVTTDKLRMIEAKIGPAVAEQCTVLARWPYNGTSATQVFDNLSPFRALVEDSPNILEQRSTTVAALYRCLGGARIISEGELPEKISGTLPYLQRSLTFDPTQALLRNNIAFLTQFLKAKGGDGKTYFVTVLQILRGADDPDIPEIAERAFDAVKK